MPNVYELYPMKGTIIEVTNGSQMASYMHVNVETATGEFIINEGGNLSR